MSLVIMRRKLDADILASGHMYKNEFHEHEGFWHINPVSGVFVCGRHCSGCVLRLFIDVLLKTI